jgi:hypothetical protein
MRPTHSSETFSIFWEIRILLYLGVLCLTSGLGILVYQNIETVGHQSILAAIALTTIACLGYCFKHAEAFSFGKANISSSWTDYLLLLAVLLFGVFIGYLQFQYSIFGSHYGLALGLPAALYFGLAYRFDHRGVLQLAISGLCGAVGLVVTPLGGFDENLFNHSRPILTGLIMGLLFALVGGFSENRNIKRHFAFSYFNFAMHLILMATLTGLFLGHDWEAAGYFALLLIATVGLIVYARAQQSYYFLLCAILYGYIGVTYVFMRFLFNSGSTGAGSIYMAFFYFVFSCAGTIFFFLNLKSLLGISDDSLSKD